MNKDIGSFWNSIITLLPAYGAYNAQKNGPNLEDCLIGFAAGAILAIFLLLFGMGVRKLLAKVNAKHSVQMSPPWRQMLGTAVGGLFVAAVIPYVFASNDQLTYGKYLEGVIASGTVKQTAKAVVDTYKTAPNSNNVDFEKLTIDLSVCLEDRIQTWIHGNDPRVGRAIHKSDVQAIVGELGRPCFDDVASRAVKSASVTE